MTRLTIRVTTSCEKPATRDPTTNSPSESWSSSFWLNRSASLPHSGTVAVMASSSEVTTQVYEDWLAPRSAMIRGRALATTVPARMATNMPAIRPDIAWSI
jgi:hypothetical protein